LASAVTGNVCPVQLKGEGSSSDWTGFLPRQEGGAVRSRWLELYRSMLLGMSRGHFGLSDWVVGGGCGKTGMGHKGKLLVGQLAPVDEVGVKCVGGGPADR
jgi:hypothetical protein